jgi:hypothetical protein
MDRNSLRNHGKQFIGKMMAYFFIMIECATQRAIERQTKTKSMTTSLLE